MLKTIWILHQYASTPETGMGGRHYYLARELAKQGHRVYLIAASYTHMLRTPVRVEKKVTVQDCEGFHFVWIKVPSYAGVRGRGRILNWIRYSWQVLGLHKEIKEKPDAIMASSPQPFLFLSAKRLAQRFGARLIYEVRDIWPRTLIEMGGLSSRHPLIMLMQWFEDQAYKNSDVVISNLPNAVEHMTGRGLDPSKFHWISNGYCAEEIQKQRPVTQDVLAKVPKNKFVVGYVGTLGLANSLHYLLDAVGLLEQKDKIAVVFVGEGPEKDNLARQAQSLGLTNVKFLGSISKEKVQSMLGLFDVCYLGWKDLPLYRYGISPNKLPEYLISGKPVINSYSGFFDVVAEANAGLSANAEDPASIAEAINKLMLMSPQMRSEAGARGARYAECNLSYRELAAKLEKLL